MYVCRDISLSLYRRMYVRTLYGNCVRMCILYPCTYVRTYIRMRVSAHMCTVFIDPENLINFDSLYVCTYVKSALNVGVFCPDSNTGNGNTAFIQYIRTYLRMYVHPVLYTRHLYCVYSLYGCVYSGD